MSQDLDSPSLKPRKSARQDRSAATVEAIVEAAARILETRGLAGFTTNAIAERAGVGVGSLYQYFPNKEAITRALIRRELELLEAEVSAIPCDGDATSAIRRFAAAAVAQQFRRPALTRLLEIEESRLEAEGDIEPVRRRVAMALSAILAAAGLPSDADIVQDVIVLTAVLVNAAASRQDVPVETLVSRIAAVIEGRLRGG